MLDKILRLYSYLFHGVLTLFLLAVSLVAFLSNTHNLQFRMLPWEGRTLTYVTLGAGLAGLFSILLAWRRGIRAPFAIYALAVFVMVFRGLFFYAGFWFRDTEQFYWGSAFCLGLFGAFLASLAGWKRKHR